MENKVLAVVNGREITERDVMTTISRFPRERQAYLNTEEGRKQLLDQILSFELIYDYAQEQSIDKDKEYLDQVENAKKEILTQYAINKFLSEVNVTEEEIKNYYNENMSMFIEQESVSAKHILVSTLEEAKEVKNKIEGGLSFEQAANEYSSCPSKTQGGDLGTFTRGRMVPEFEKAAFELAIGVVSEPVQTQFGYHLIKVEQKNSANVKSLNEVASSVRNNLIQEKQTERYMQLTEELKKKYNVQVK